MKQHSTKLFLLAVVMVGIGLGTAPAMADPGNTNNNGNHYGWSNQGGQYSQNYSSVPEPVSLALLGAGLAGIGIWRRVSRKV